MRRLLPAIFALLFSTGLLAQSVDIPNSARQIADDMALPHQAALHGVPDYYEWAAGPRISLGQNPGRFKVMLAWGQFYEAATGNQASNTRIQVRNMRAYYLSAIDQQWHVLQSTVSVEGGAYTEDYAGNESRTADIRAEPDGGISVMVGGGYNFHFWPDMARAVLPQANEIVGIFTTVQARLVLDRPSDPDDRAVARYLLGVGGDYWLDQTALPRPNDENNEGIALGRHRFVTTDWQWFNMTTLSRAQLMATPPPL